MDNQEYDQKKWECWTTFKNQSECEGGCLMADAFFHAFDRAYALGKQEKELKSMQLSDVKEKIDAWMESHTEEEVYELLKKHGAVEDANTVIQGWVARDRCGDLYIYTCKPERLYNLGCWDGNVADVTPSNDLFPDITWESEPEQIEIIKRKKNG